MCVAINEYVCLCMFAYMHECVSVNKCVHMYESVAYVWGNSGSFGAGKGALRQGFLLGKTKSFRGSEGEDLDVASGEASLKVLQGLSPGC